MGIDIDNLPERVATAPEGKKRDHIQESMSHRQLETIKKYFTNTPQQHSMGKLPHHRTHEGMTHQRPASEQIVKRQVRYAWQDKEQHHPPSHSDVYPLLQIILQNKPKLSHLFLQKVYITYDTLYINSHLYLFMHHRICIGIILFNILISWSPLKILELPPEMIPELSFMIF
jgi:hypothetical protein